MSKLELVIDNKVIDVPEQMTVGQYQTIMLTPELYENNSLMLISLFTGIPIPEIKNMTVDQVNLIEAFLSTRIELPKENELVLTFMHDGVEYGLENNWGKMAFGCWIDFEVYSADNIFGNLHKIMAILYRPVITKDKKNPKKYKIVPYKSEEIEDRAEIMRNVPIQFWLGASQFFFSIVKIYIENMQDSLELKMKMETMATKTWKKLPKFLQKRLPLDSISLSPTNSQKKM